MFVLRLLGLSVLAVFCFAMGTIPASQANGIARTFAPLIFVVGPLLYFLPTIEAKLRGHEKLGALAALNFFLGWTLVGWVASLVWALSHKPAPAERRSGYEMREQDVPVSPPLAVARSDEKACPFCAETIKAAAKVCKHCGRDLPSQAAAAGA